MNKAAFQLMEVVILLEITELLNLEAAVNLLGTEMAAGFAGDEGRPLACKRRSLPSGGCARPLSLELALSRPCPTMHVFHLDAFLP